MRPVAGGLHSLGILFATSRRRASAAEARPYDPALSAVPLAFAVRFFEEFVLPLEERTGARLSTREVCSALIRTKTWCCWTEWLSGQERRPCVARRYVDLLKDLSALDEDEMEQTWAGGTGRTWPVRFLLRERLAGAA